MTDKTPKERAIDKTNLEISKDINEVIEIAKRLGVGEIFYYLHYLHFIRLIKVFGNVPENQKEVSAVYVRQMTDAYKYIIQVLFKHSPKQFVKNSINNSFINPKGVQFLTGVVLGINSKYETLSFLTLFDNLEVYGERGQFVKLHLETVTKDERLNKFFNYAVRADRENDLQKKNVRTKNDFLKHFSDEYIPYSDLFEVEFTITLDDFINLIDYILETVTSQIQANEKKYVFLENGKVDIQAYGTIMLFGNSLLINKQILIDKFGQNSKKIIERLTFKPTEFEEQQLRYNLIARQPLLDYGDKLLVSPEILLDSLFVNSHYSLLEASSSKEEYKKRYSSIFVDKISQIAGKYDYTEVTRELELFDGKNQIGDLDLVLKSSNNQYLLVEAKNHTIPMDVYFHDFEATEKRLAYLTKEWEAKVDRRFKHLHVNYANYSIAPTFTYIVISKSPEILSHFSNYLVLNLSEFEYWLSQDDTTLTFQKVFEDFYKMNEDTFTPEQMEQMQKDLNTGWRFEKE